MAFEGGTGFNAKGGSGGGGGGGIIVPVSITYAELKSLYDSASLAAGTFYLITDFQSVYDQPDFYYSIYLGNGTDLPKNASDIVAYSGQSEPIIVEAVTNSGLSSYAQSTIYPTDTIQYDITFSTTEVTGTPAFGRITERISATSDSSDNNSKTSIRTDYDWRNINFKRYNIYTAGATVYSTNRVETIVAGTDVSITIDAAGGSPSFSSILSGDILYFTSTIPTVDPFGGTNQTIFWQAEVDSVISSTQLQLKTIDSTKYLYLDSEVGTTYNFTVGINSSINGAYAQQFATQQDRLEFNVTIPTFGNPLIQQLNIDCYIGNYANAYVVSIEPFILSNNVFLSTARSVQTKEYFKNNSFLKDVIDTSFAENFYDNIFWKALEYSNFGVFNLSNYFNESVSGLTTGTFFQNNILDAVESFIVGDNVFDNDFRTIDISNAELGSNLSSVVFSTLTNTASFQAGYIGSEFNCLDGTGRLLLQFIGNQFNLYSNVNDFAFSIRNNGISGGWIGVVPNDGGVLTVSQAFNIAYGSTTDLSALVIGGSVRNYVYTSGTGASTFKLPINTNAGIGTTIKLNDLLAISSTNHITVDAGTGNTINGTTIAQTFTILTNGQTLSLTKLSATAWKIQ